MKKRPSGFSQPSAVKLKRPLNRKNEESSFDFRGKGSIRSLPAALHDRKTRGKSLGKKQVMSSKRRIYYLESGVGGNLVDGGKAQRRATRKIRSFGRRQST